MNSGSRGLLQSGSVWHLAMNTLSRFLSYSSLFSWRSDLKWRLMNYLAHSVLFLEKSLLEAQIKMLMLAWNSHSQKQLGDVGSSVIIGPVIAGFSNRRNFFSLFICFYGSPKFRYSRKSLC